MAQVAEDAAAAEKSGLIYRPRLLLAKNSLRVNVRETPLLPGLAVTSGRATDRRLIEFFLIFFG